MKAKKEQLLNFKVKKLDCHIRSETGQSKCALQENLVGEGF